MQTRGYLLALVAALVVLGLQLWTMRQANWILWSKEGELVSTSIQYGPLRTCTRLIVRFASAESTTINSSSSSSISAVSDRLAHPEEKDDGWVCRPFPDTSKDCNSDGDRAFCNAFLSAGYALQLSGILLLGSAISSILTVFSHSPLNKVEGYRVVGGLLGTASLLAIVAFAIVVDAFKNDWPYLWGAKLSLGTATYVELAAWIVGTLATLGLLVVGFRAERGARTGAAPVDGYTRI
ncbi:hypothetical protein OC844_002620 [Tilletia horrida]|nr:hypothetical protein OC844_002620 [Tilletia horrida]